MDQLPIYVWAIVAIGVIGMPATICVLLWRGGIAAGLGRRTAVSISAAAGIVWAVWTISSALLADADVYRLEPGIAKPWIGVAMLVALALAFLFTRIPVVSRILAGPDVLWQLTLPQVTRVVGIAFVIALALGKLPAVFALPAGLGDIAIGVEAVFLARSVRRGVVGRSAVWFNIFGLLDLVVAMTIGITAGLGPTRLLVVTPSTEAISLLPLALILITMVPLAMALHLMSLARLRRPAGTRSIGQPVASTA
jgi:hypothetical protein